jgi:hypothetical protein
MNYLNNVFEQPGVANWIAYAGAERAPRVGLVTGVVGKNNADWQAGARPDFYIEAQRIGYQVVLGGLASNAVAMIDLGLKAIEWGYQPSVMGATNDWSGNRDYATILAHAAHPRTMFGAASVETVLAILTAERVMPGIDDRASALTTAIRYSAAAYIESGDAAAFRVDCTNSSQLVFQATWMQGAAVLTGDIGFKAEAKATIRAMMALQLDSGAFGEKGGYDTGYTVQTLRELVAYRDMLAGEGGGSWWTQVTTFINRGANWLISRISPDGAIDTTGNSRTAADGPPLMGDFPKGWDRDAPAIVLAQYATAFGRWDELAPLITAVQFRGQAYDHIGDIGNGK